MDTTALIFYAVVCGTLSAVSPRLSGAPARITIGAVVGVVAAALLPQIKSLLF